MDTGTGVKGIIRKGNQFLVLVKPDGAFDLPGGRVEDGESIKAALHREISEECIVSKESGQIKGIG